MSPKERAIKYLEDMRQAPGMYAEVRESLVGQVYSVVRVFVDESGVEFCKKHLGYKGNTYLDSLGKIEDKWAQAVIDDGLEKIRNS